MDENLRKITDGRFYSANDMVKVGCHDCAGCSTCCKDMGNSILLDPYDVYRLSKGLGMSIEELFGGPVELGMQEGLILPNLRMVQKGMEQVPSCSFLNEEGRCRIHAYRPGICRLFPLGRNYEGDTMNYFLLTKECPAENKTKMKVNKWLDCGNVREYEKYLVTWHAFTKRVREKVLENSCTEAAAKQITMLMLQVFYMKEYSGENFFDAFYQRMEEYGAYFA